MRMVRRRNGSYLYVHGLRAVLFAPRHHRARQSAWIQVDRTRRTKAPFRKGIAMTLLLSFLFVGALVYRALYKEVTSPRQPKEIDYKRREKWDKIFDVSFALYLTLCIMVMAVAVWSILHACRSYH